MPTKKTASTKAPAKSPTKGGVKRPRVRTGKIDPMKARIAKKALGAGQYGMNRSAGMLLDTTQQSAPYKSGNTLETYRSSYAYGLGDRSGSYDIPTYFVRMNEQNGGLLYWPVTLREKYSWYRYWARTDAYVGRALELLSDLPMSKLALNMPKAKGDKNGAKTKLTKEKREEIHNFFTEQMRVIGGFNLCQSILWEWNMIGNVYIFHEWDDKKKMWSRAVMLPPEEVNIFQYPFSDNKRVEYKPEYLIRMIGDSAASIGASGASAVPTANCGRGNMDEEIMANIPEELVAMVRSQGCIVMDSDPNTGSFVHHIARRRSPYMDLGASVLERVLVPMLQKEHFRYTQLSLASRNMTPKNLISAENLLPAELDDLRTQVDLSYMDPEYSIITNYPVTWEQIGAENRLLDLDREYERIEKQIFAAMGVTRELLTGESSFSGSKITVDILNTMFLLSREILRDYIEQTLFVPVCEAHGWYDEDKNGIKTYWYPKISFNRLTIRDNAEVFDSLFQLYQKGSLPVDIIYELFNLNADDIDEKLMEDLFTVKDANFNRVVEEMSGEIGRALVERTDAPKKMATYLGLDYEEPAPEDEGGFGEDGFDEGAGDDFSTEEPAPGSLSEGDKESLADAVVESLPDGATESDIESIVNEIEGEPK